MVLVEPAEQRQACASLVVGTPQRVPRASRKTSFLILLSFVVMAESHADEKGCE